MDHGFNANDLETLRKNDDTLLLEIEAAGGLVIRDVQGVYKPHDIPGSLCMTRSADGFTLYGQVAVDLTGEQAATLMEWLVGQFGMEIGGEVVPTARTMEMVRELLARMEKTTQA